MGIGIGCKGKSLTSSFATTAVFSLLDEDAKAIVCTATLNGILRVELVNRPNEITTLKYKSENTTEIRSIFFEKAGGKRAPVVFTLRNTAMATVQDRAEKSFITQLSNIHGMLVDVIK